MQNVPKIKYIFGIILVTFFLWSCNNDKPKMKEISTKNTFYIGTYTSGNSKGIYKAAIDEKGKFSSLKLAASSSNPSFLSWSEDKTYLLAVNENEDGTIESYRLEKDSLVYVNKTFSGGAHPCHILLGKNNTFLVSNYTGGNLSYVPLSDSGTMPDVFEVKDHDGQGTHARQEAPHVHSAWIAEDHIIAVDLGTNELWIYDLSKDTLSLNQKLALPSEAGPRHLAIHPQTQSIYVLNELSSSISIVKKEQDRYHLKQSFPTLPESFEGENYCADIHISSDGHFLYASNRGHNSLSIFKIDETGQLILIGHQSIRGDWPRNFALSPDEKFIIVANERSNQLISFSRDSQTGKLEFRDQIDVPNPVCILF